MIDPPIIALLTLVAMIAGFVDSIAGGGGLILLPSMLFCGISPLFAFGTNKLQSVFGTSMALRNYWRQGLIDWRGYRPSMVAVIVGALAGAMLVQSVKPGALRIIVPIFLFISSLYVLFSPRMTDDDAHERLSATGYAPVALAIGWYDGFFGPGAGTFYTTSLVALRGHGLTRATALAKFLNLASATTSLVMFALAGKIYWSLGLCMAVGAIAGGWLGSHTALRFGAALIRPLLVTISLALTAKLLIDYFSA